MAQSGSLKYLTASQVQFYKDNGYLLLENWSTPVEVSSMRLAADAIMDRLEQDKSIQITIFDTGKEQAQVRTKYFLDSVNQVVPFFEAKALDTDKKTFKVSFKKSINKIGHALHVHEETFKNVTHSQQCKDLCEDIGLTHPVVPQSMYILKEADVGGEVTPHQDSSFLDTLGDAPSCTGFWIALDDATVENGCLWVIPGSHKDAVKTKFVETANGWRYDPDIGDTWKVWPKDTFTPIPVRSGTCVLIHGALVHMSLENASPKARHIYSWHVVSSDQKFSEKNWMGTGPFAPL